MSEFRVCRIIRDVGCSSSFDSSFFFQKRHLLCFHDTFALLLLSLLCSFSKHQMPIASHPATISLWVILFRPWGPCHLYVKDQMNISSPNQHCPSNLPLQLLIWHHLAGCQTGILSITWSKHNILVLLQLVIFSSCFFLIPIPIQSISNSWKL
jgi:hypothetical protein